MRKKELTNTGIRLLLLSMLSLNVSSITHAHQGMSREDVTSTGQWLDTRKARFSGKPIFLHLRTGHERTLLMPEPVRLSDASFHPTGYEADITGAVVSFYPMSHFERASFHLTGLETGTDYILQVRASAFGIRQPLQIFLAD